MASVQITSVGEVETSAGGVSHEKQGASNAEAAGFDSSLTSDESVPDVSVVHTSDDGLSDMAASQTSEVGSTSIPNDGVEVRTVSFSTLEMREYPIIVGENPGVTMGVPLTIGWEHASEIRCSVDDYENSRPKPRSMIELRIPSSMRSEILKRSGFTRNEIMAGIKRANIGRKKRTRTKEMMGLSSIEESVELIVRALLNATIRRRRKRLEREFLDDYKVLCFKDTDPDATVEGESCCSLTTS